MGGGFSFVWPSWVEMNFRVRFFCVFFFKCAKLSPSVCVVETSIYR
jgi:hypothetical protein